MRMTRTAWRRNLPNSNRTAYQEPRTTANARGMSEMRSGTISILSSRRNAPKKHKDLSIKRRTLPNRKQSQFVLESPLERNEMEAVRIEAIVQPNGRVILNDLPFEEGKQVEVIVLETNERETPPTANPLKGSVLRYDDPFEPAA